jgi:hypothetical protein
VRLGVAPPYPGVMRSALLAGALVIALAGCGGSGKPAATGYVQQVDAVAKGLDAVTNELYTPTDTSSAAAELATVQAELRKVARQLAAITPPAAVKADHERLVAAVDELARGAGSTIARLKGGTGVGTGRGSLLKGAADARAAIAAIRAAGYEIQIPLLG